MTFSDVVQTTASVILSVGGAGAIIFSLSGWLGKVWADRLMQGEIHKHNAQLEELRDSLRLRSEEQLVSLRSQLEFIREVRVKDQLDRMMIYRAATDVIAGIVAKIELILSGERQPLDGTELHEFEAQRLRMYAYLAMHAPQAVIDAHDAIIDNVLAVVYDGKKITWPEMRQLAIQFLNEVRKDIGMNTDPIEYRGVR